MKLRAASLKIFFKSQQTISPTHQGKKRERAEVNKPRNERGEITTNTTEIQVIRGYCDTQTNYTT